MSKVSRFLRIAVIGLGGLAALPVVIVFAVLSFLFIVASMGVLAVRGLFRQGPRWDDSIFAQQYEAEAVRANSSKMDKQPIIIDHE